MELKITCPFCEQDMEKVSSSNLAGMRVFRCGLCHSEFRQPMAVRPGKKDLNQPERESQGCNACFESQVQCHNCGDGVCDSHQKTWRRYSEHMPREMLADMGELDWDKIYCPLCFPLMIERRTMRIHRRKKPDSPFRSPLTIILIAAVIFFSFVARNC